MTNLTLPALHAESSAMAAVLHLGLNWCLTALSLKQLPVRPSQPCHLPIRVLLVSMLAAMSAFCAVEQSPADTFRKQLGALTDKQLPGVAVLVARDGKILFQGGFGMANVETSEPVTPHTKFRLASTSKHFTAAAILRLADDGKLALDDPLEKFFPGYPRGKEITLYHLLTHTSGIHSWTEKYGRTGRVGKPITPDALIAWFRNDPLDFEPGAGFHYSNSGYDLLGEIIAKASGKPYGEYLKEVFFDPLGMRDTGVYVNASPPEQMSVGYSIGKGKAVRAFCWDASWGPGSGALYSTVGDLFRWNEALFGGRVLKEASLKIMTTPVKLPQNVYTLNYGCGLDVCVGELNRLPIMGHGGCVDGWCCNLVRLPEQNCTVVTLANSYPCLPGFDAFGLTYRMTGEFLKDDIQRLPPLRENPDVDGKSWPDFAGRYYFYGGELIVTPEAGRLYARFTGGSRCEIFPLAPDVFFWKESDMLVRFLRDAKGEVVAAQLPNKRAPRIRHFWLDRSVRDRWTTLMALFFLPMSVLCVPIWFFGRKRVRWMWLDFCAAWLPFVAWLALLWMNCMPKGLLNIGEAFLVGALVSLCPALRLIGKKWMEEKKMAWVTAALGVALAGAAYFLTPYLSM